MVTNNSYSCHYSIAPFKHYQSQKTMQNFPVLLSSFWKFDTTFENLDSCQDQYISQMCHFHVISSEYNFQYNIKRLWSIPPANTMVGFCLVLNSNFSQHYASIFYNWDLCTYCKITKESVLGIHYLPTIFRLSPPKIGLYSNPNPDPKLREKRTIFATCSVGWTHISRSARRNRNIDM